MLVTFLHVVVTLVTFLHVVVALVTVVHVLVTEVTLVTMVVTMAQCNPTKVQINSLNTHAFIKYPRMKIISFYIYSTALTLHKTPHAFPQSY